MADLANEKASDQDVESSQNNQTEDTDIDSEALDVEAQKQAKKKKDAKKASPTTWTNAINEMMAQFEDEMYKDLDKRFFGDDDEEEKIQEQQEEIEEEKQEKQQQQEEAQQDINAEKEHLEVQQEQTQNMQKMQQEEQDMNIATLNSMIDDVIDYEIDSDYDDDLDNDLSDAIDESLEESLNDTPSIDENEISSQQEMTQPPAMQSMSSDSNFARQKLPNTQNAAKATEHMNQAQNTSSPTPDAPTSTSSGPSLGGGSDA